LFLDQNSTRKFKGGFHYSLNLRISENLVSNLVAHLIVRFCINQGFLFSLCRNLSTFISPFDLKKLSG